MDQPKRVFLCEKELTLSVMGGKWKPIILWTLSEGTKRFGELKKQLAPVTQKTLTQQLRELEDDFLIHRKVYPVFPAKVEYSLSAHGKSLIPILALMMDWGKTYKQAVTQYKIEIQSLQNSQDGMDTDELHVVPEHL